MTLQYISDDKGKVKAVQVQIPIKEWESAKNQFVIPKKEIKLSPRKQKIWNGIKEALKEVEQIEKGEIVPKTIEQFLSEL